MTGTDTRSGVRKETPLQRQVEGLPLTVGVVVSVGAFSVVVGTLALALTPRPTLAPYSPELRDRET